MAEKELIKTTEEISIELECTIISERKATYNQRISEEKINNLANKKWVDYDKLMEVIDGGFGLNVQAYRKYLKEGLTDNG